MTITTTTIILIVLVVLCLTHTVHFSSKDNYCHHLLHTKKRHLTRNNCYEFGQILLSVSRKSVIYKGFLKHDQHWILLMKLMRRLWGRIWNWQLAINMVCCVAWRLQLELCPHRARPRVPNRSGPPIFSCLLHTHFFPTWGSYLILSHHILLFISSYLFISCHYLKLVPLSHHTCAQRMSDPYTLSCHIWI